MSKKYMAVLNDFSAGINERDASNLIPDNALVEAQNAVLGKGYVSKRHGYKRHTHSPNGANVVKWSDIGPMKWSEI